MNISTAYLRGLLVVSVSGVVDRNATGRLSDALVDCVRKGSGMLIVDLSQVRLMTHAGARAFIVAAKLMESAGGQMRMCGARIPVDIVLRGLGFNHLLKLDATLAASVEALVPNQFGQDGHVLVRITRNAAATRSERDVEGIPAGLEQGIMDTAA